MAELANLTAVAAAGLAGVFQGTANLAFLSCTYFGQPKDTPAAEIVRTFRALQPCGKKMQPPVALACAAASAATAVLKRGPAGAAPSPTSVAFGVAAASQVAALALTVTKILPVDSKLLALDFSSSKGGSKGKGSNGGGGDDARALLEEWGRLHAVRAGLGLLALGSTLVGVHSMLPK